MKKKITNDNGLLEAKRQNIEMERSDKWNEVREAYLKKFPDCAVCGSTKNLQVHHIFPFHYCIALGCPDLELDDRNLITLCETKGFDHHLLIGHFDDFKSSNLNVKNDVQTYHNLTEAQIRMNGSWLKATLSTITPLDEMSDQEKSDFTAKMNITYPKI